MKKIPYEISDYKDLILGNYYYIDKTKYLEKLDDDNDTLIYLRPGKFGKSLFTSMMFYYYDLNSKDSFESLFKDTYIYNNPTPSKNNYYVLKLDFSKIKESSKNVYDSFNDCVVAGIRFFCEYYDFDYQVDETKNANMILLFFLSDCFKLENKIYIIIDDYDAYIKSLLEEDEQSFESISSMAKAFYAVIKEYIGLGVIGRFFATGNCRLDLTTMTSGFNIAWELTADPRYHDMIGLTSDEVQTLIKEVVFEKDQEKVYQLMLENYGGYLFSKRVEEKLFNADLVMYLLINYEKFKEIPKEIIEKNRTNCDEAKKIIELKHNPYSKELLEKILLNDQVSGTLKSFFILELDCDRNDILSLLYYFGYLTIETDEYGDYYFKIPNRIMKEIFENIK